jgi:threonine synthase
VVLYPEGRVSPLQEAQLTTLGGNVTAVRVEGTFDDCQRLAKGAFADPELVAATGLTSANSINIGRLLPQVVYYVHAVGELRRLAPDAPAPLVCVPSGNFGNLTAGLMAARMGLEVGGFVAGTNVNDVVPRYLESGRYRPRSAVRTLSNAMDVGDPSNFERILALVGGKVEGMRALFSASRHDDAATRAAIAEVHRRTGVVLDPHTAVGWLALREARGHAPGAPEGILLATAHPAKFADEVAGAIGRPVELPSRLAVCLERPREVVPMSADPEALADLLSGPG